MLKGTGAELLGQPEKHQPGRRQQRHRRVAERRDRLPHRDRQRDRYDPEQHLRCERAAVHAKLSGMSKPGSDHRTSRLRSFSNAASRPIPIAPMTMIMA